MISLQSSRKSVLCNQGCPSTRADMARFQTAQRSSQTPAAVIEIERDSDEPSSSSSDFSPQQAVKEEPRQPPVLVVRKKPKPEVASKKANVRKGQTVSRRVEKTLSPDDEIVSIKEKLKTPEYGTTYSVKLKGVRGLQLVPAADLFEYPVCQALSLLQAE